MFALAAAGPVVLATLLVSAFSGLDLAGHTPLSIGPARNIAEAAALGQASEVLRRLRFGEDPNRVWPVRKEIISSTITRVTALEAALYSSKSQLVELLDRQGAIVGEEGRRHLTCLASDLGVTDVVQYLSRKQPAHCTPGEALAVVRHRSEDD